MAKEVCKTMAVIGAKLRGAFNISSRLPEAASPLLPTAGGNGGAQLQQQQQWRQPSSVSDRASVAAATAAAVRHLAEACAPGRGGDGVNGGGGGDGDVGRREFPGLSLTASVLLAEKSERRGVSARGAAALVGACTALHVHLLDWLALVAAWEGGDERGSAFPEAAAAAATVERRRERAAGASEGIGDFLVGFSRRTLLDLLFMFEKTRPVIPTARTSGVDRQEAEEEAFSKEPLAELLCAVMDALDGTGVGKSTCLFPYPPSSVVHSGRCGDCCSLSV